MSVTPAPASAPAVDLPPLRRLRHRREVPMLALGGVLSLAAVVVATWGVATGRAIPDALSGAIFAILLGPVAAAIVFIRYQFWSVIVNSVEVTPHQFPQIYDLYVESAERLRLTSPAGGMNSLPRLYVSNGNGMLNAYASKCQISRAYVVIYSDLVDVAYEHGDLDTIRFVLSHELGHIKCRHVSIWRTMLAPVASLIFLQPSITRAQEYSADRVASLVAPQGAMGMTVLYAGKRMYRHLDLDAYFHSVAQHRRGFWARLSNFLSSHPIGFARLSTLRRVEHEGWDVHGPML